MSATELRRAPSNYGEIAEIHGRRVLLHQRFGSYQGEWATLARSTDGVYYLYKGWYGSCSGCDDIEATWDSSGEMVSTKAVREWADGYRPFAEIPNLTARELARRGTFAQVLPANAIYDEMPVDQFAIECTALIILEEGLEFDLELIFKVQNMETRRRLAEVFGPKALIKEVVAVEEESADQLVRLTDDNLYLLLHDGSTDREYLLCVPPEMVRVRQAKAWSFEISEEEYAPLIET